MRHVPLKLVHLYVLLHARSNLDALAAAVADSAGMQILMQIDVWHPDLWY